MVKRRLKPFAIHGDRAAACLAARAEDLLKANADIHGETYDRLDALEREASYHQANSKEAALFHLSVLARIGARLSEQQVEQEIERLVMMHHRLVRSLTIYLETVTGVDRRDCGMTFYLGRREP